MRFTEFLREGIIVPKIEKIITTNVKSLNKNFNDANIYFEKSDEKGAHYEAETDKIVVYVNPYSTVDSITNSIKHEMVHREQNKRSKGKYAGVVEKNLKRINDIAEEYNELIKLQKSEETDQKIEVLSKEYGKLADNFHYGTKSEQMAYALQLVIMHPYVKDVNALYRKITQNVNYKVKKDNTFKKYLGMYWMIRKEL